MVHIANIFIGLILASLSECVGPAETYALCQKRTTDPLEGCPKGTIFVSFKDQRATFKSIQTAIRSLPNDTSPQIILIGAGIYSEQLNVTRPGPLTLLGQSSSPFRGRQYADVGYNTTAHNEVQIHHNAANQNNSYPDNLHTSVLAVGPTYNATLTGAGPTGYPVDPKTPFGCRDFRAYNIDFRNEWAPRASGPAHALAVGYANAGFYSCGFYSWQDTVYVGKLANVFMHDSIVAGQTDFLYGFGTMFVAKSTLLLRNCGGGITAWKGTNTTLDNKYGVYIANTKVIAANATVLREQEGKCSLGRPWNNIHRSLFRDTYFDATILPAGYTSWDGAPNNNFGVNTTMAVFRNHGPGNNIAAQEGSNITVLWEKEQASSYYKPEDVFMSPKGDRPDYKWIDGSILQHAGQR